MNVFYFKDINAIGGVESFFWYLAKTYNNIVVYYRNADETQIKRLAHIIEVHKYKGETIKCKRFFCCYNPDILDNVEAEEYIHLVHCDYKQVNFNPITNKKFTKYIGVSKLACDSFTELTGIPCELIYNPVNIEIPKVEKQNDKLHLISATRLSKEKGLKRMQQLARLLEINKIDYEWVVYTNRKRQPIGNNVIYKDSKIDIIKDIAKADYLVQLSDCEAFCYSIVESLMVKTPVIATDLPVLKELGVIHGVNSVICDFNMKNVDIDLIKKKSLKFDYNPPKSNWGKYLDNNSTYNPKEKIEVFTNKKYLDVELGHLEKNKPYKMTKERAAYLECKDLIRYSL